MQVDDFIQDTTPTPFMIPQIAWLAGAAKGLKIVGNRTPKWLWQEFYDDIFQMIRLAGVITPTDPGTAPNEGDGLVGSAIEALGGYVSVTSELTPEGLYFRVPLVCQENIVQLLKGLTVLKYHGEIVIPTFELPAFIRLVPIEGPVAEMLEEEEIS